MSVLFSSLLIILFRLCRRFFFVILFYLLFYFVRFVLWWCRIHSGAWYHLELKSTDVAEGRYIKGDPLKGYYDFIITGKSLYVCIYSFRDVYVLRFYFLLHEHRKENCVQHQAMTFLFLLTKTYSTTKLFDRFRSEEFHSSKVNSVDHNVLFILTHIYMPYLIWFNKLKCRFDNEIIKKNLLNPEGSYKFWAVFQVSTSIYEVISQSMMFHFMVFVGGAAVFVVVVSIFIQCTRNTTYFHVWHHSLTSTYI